MRRGLQGYNDVSQITGGEVLQNGMMVRWMSVGAYRVYGPALTQVR